MFSFAGLLQLRVAGSSELLTVTCPSLSEAENIADLIDGYCRLVNNSPTSIWMRRGKIRTPLIFLAQHDFNALQVALFQKHSFTSLFNPKNDIGIVQKFYILLFCLHYVEDIVRKTLTRIISEQSRCNFLD